jgi:hypothetical protein
VEVTVHDAVVARYGTYSEESDSDPIRWGAANGGGLVEWVECLVGEGEARKLTLDASINGERLEVGSTVNLLCSLRGDAQVVYRRDGRERIITRDKWKVLGMEAGEPAKG